MSQKAIPNIRVGSGGPPGGIGRVGKPYRRFGTGWEALLEFWDGSGGFSKGAGRVGRPTQRSGMGLEALPVVCDGSGGSP